jgi:hypothetical protein
MFIFFVPKTNLVMVTLLELDLVKKLERLLQALYVFFMDSPKKFLELPCAMFCWEHHHPQS